MADQHEPPRREPPSDDPRPDAADRGPGLDREQALRVLGLGPSPAPEVLRRRLARLRAHLELRLARERDPGRRWDRAREASELEAALEGIPGPGRRRTPVSPGPVGAALAGLAATGLLVAHAGGWLRGPDPAPPAFGGDAAPAVTEAAQGPADADAVAVPQWGELALRSRVEEARARVTPLDEDGVPGEPRSWPLDGQAHRLPAGLHRIEVRHPDCPGGFDETLRVAAGARVEREAQPCPDTGWVTVRSPRLDDRLSIDGVSVGPTSPSRHAVAPGPRRLRVEVSDAPAWEETVRIAPGEHRTLQARFRAVRERRPPADPRDPEPYADEPGGSAGWFDAVALYMRDRYDLDGSGQIDTKLELAQISCYTWRRIELSYEQGGLGPPLTRLYGFDGSQWVPGALGIDGSLRAQSYSRMRACGLR